MVATSVIAGEQERVLKGIRAIIEEHHPEAATRLDRFNSVPGRVPNSLKQPEQYGLFMAEAVLMLAETVAELKEASKSRKRGRPRKAESKDS